MIRKKISWFTHCNIDTRREQKCEDNNGAKYFVDLTDFIDIFLKNEIWKRTKYRFEYKDEYDKEDLSKIKSLKIFLHSEEAPYSNAHSYEKIINKHTNIDNFEKSKITSSGIGEAFQIAVIEAEYDSEQKVIDDLTYDEEKDFEIIFDKKLSDENIKSWNETKRIKSIISEFLQFFTFNLHLNFPSYRYSFSFTDKPLHTGFIVLTDGNSYYYETDKTDFLSHYILYESEKDCLLKIMNETAQFWHKEIPSIHFFLDALKGSCMTINNFSKLVFTLETFFSEGTSNDFITLTIPLVIGKNIKSMKKIRETLRDSFKIRNNYVHGKEILNLRTKFSKKKDIKIDDVFFELKNIIIHIFSYYLNNNLYLSKNNEKINHELMFRIIHKTYNIKSNDS